MCVCSSRRVLVDPAGGKGAIRGGGGDYSTRRQSLAVDLNFWGWSKGGAVFLEEFYHSLIPENPSSFHPPSPPPPLPPTLAFITPHEQVIAPHVQYHERALGCSSVNADPPPPGKTSHVYHGGHGADTRKCREKEYFHYDCICVTATRETEYLE
jgi:hypothetical protein